MLLGALLDLGLSLEELRQGLSSLQLEGFQIVSRRVLKNHISATQIKIMAPQANLPLRNFEDISQIISASHLPKPVKEKALAIFKDLAFVEAKIHGCPIEEIHFHELGAMDSIIDIVGSVFALYLLGIDSLYVSRLPLGSGFVECSHGKLPVPAPATLELLKNIPVYDSGIRQELVTPTGAALVKNLGTGFGIMPPMKIQNIGYGAGTRQLEQRPNVLRIIMGEEIPVDSPTTDTVVVLECNIDDCNPEWLGYLMERLLESGALDVTFTPIQMKKNRPGIKVEVISPPGLRDNVLEIMFEESSTLGIRYRYSERQILSRFSEQLDQSPWGRIRVKKVVRPDGSAKYLPEYEECKRIAKENKIPLRQIYDWISALNHNQ